MSTILDQRVQYLDLDGDGVPDAVLSVESFASAGTDELPHVTVIETLERGIGIDGRPSDVDIVAHD